MKVSVLRLFVLVFGYGITIWVLPFVGYCFKVTVRGFFIFMLFRGGCSNVTSWGLLFEGHCLVAAHFRLHLWGYYMGGNVLKVVV